MSIKERIEVIEAAGLPVTAYRLTDEGFATINKKTARKERNAKIIEDYNKGVDTMDALAKKYGLTTASISYIVAGKR